MAMLLDQYGSPIDTRRMAAERRLARVRRQLDSLTASYDAAATTTENSKHWRFTDTLSAAAANSATVRKTLRQRSRYEILENNSYGRGISYTLAHDTISTGPSLQILLPDVSASRMIEQRWRKWAKDVGLTEKLRTGRLAEIIDGETVMLRGTNRRSKNLVKLDVRLIEAEQLATPGFADGLPNEVDGIKFDEWGQAIQYTVLRGHPGDLWPLHSWEADNVSPDDLIHMFRCDRPGQKRGIPAFTPALPLFAQLRRYTLAVLLAAETAANFTAVLQTQAGAFESDTDGIEDLEPFDLLQIDRGMLTSLPRGWGMNQMKPEQPTTTYEMFRNALLNEIARCVHMPANKARADSSGYNYSSGRLDHQTYYEAIAVDRCRWEIEALDRILCWWLEEAMQLDGYLPAFEAEDELPHVWRWPPHRDVDQKELADVSISLIKAGLKTRSQFLIEQNIDPEAHARQLIAEGWVNPDAPEPQPVGPIAGSPATPGAAPPTPGAQESITPGANAPPVPDEPPPTGEFANMSRQQLTRNMKAIDDAIAKIESGEWSPARARVFLSSVGLTQRTVDNLLHEYEEQPEPEETPEADDA